MGCKVMNIGTNDLAAGVEFVSQLQNMAEFPFISANIMAAGETTLMFPPSAIVKTHDRTLGFVGVTVGDKRLKEFDFDDPIKSAKAAVAELKDKVDLIFLMANVDEKTEKMLTQEVDGVHFLLRSKTGSMQRNPKEQNGTVVIKIGKQGKYAAALKIRNVEESSKMTNVSAQYSRIKFTQNRLDALAKDLKSGETLEEHYAGDEKRLQLISRLRAEQDQNKLTITQLRNTYYLEATPLNDKIEDTPEVALIVEDYMPKVKEEETASKH